MSNYYYTTVNCRPLHSPPTEAKPVAKVVFETENSHSATGFILDALDALGVTKADSGMLTEFGDIVRLDDLPSGMFADQASWSNENVKIWLINSPNHAL